MKKRLTVPVLTALLGAFALPALAQATPAQTTPAQNAQLGAAWSAPTLANATYVILDPRIEGNPNIISGDQRTGILAAMKRDSAGAIKRHYPNAIIADNPQTPGAIKVTPVLQTPNALVPWAKLTAALHFDLASGQRVTLNDQFGLLTLWQHQAEAANFLYDQLAKRLP
ncbi:hypothetical protein Dcar01_00747 [Deinococcus carri]|uniref:Uncharacterized protein n=1 Tax=Deinococcus carri TaxID=1211323 RepID=A0ABP9W7S5_9DEIO